MSRFAQAAPKTASHATASRGLLAGGVWAGLLCAAAALSPTPAQEAAPAKATPPDLSSGDTGWISMGGEWIAKPGSPPPVSFDPAHPYVPSKWINRCATST
jgi:hypothetical protein